MRLSARLEHARNQIEFARQYTLNLLEDMGLLEEEGLLEGDRAEWFAQPDGTCTHIAWQIGHLTMAEYGLCLFRQRGRQPIDTELMSSKFRKQFSRGSAPNPDPAQNPTPAEILQVFQRVHAQVLEELPNFSEEQLDEPINKPYAVCASRIGALYFCSHHEMLHAGQIGMLRRLLGNPPIR
ncbi:MAG: DinB family protein [Pirellulales bacterium]